MVRMRNFKKVYILLLGVVLLVLVLSFSVWYFDYPHKSQIWDFVNLNKTIIFILFFSVILSVQNIFTLVWMLYGWSNPENEHFIGPPKDSMPPKYSFTALLPARHEAAVIGDTIAALARVNYPKDLTEVLVIIREDDHETLQAAQKAIEGLGDTSIKLLIVDGFPINKPRSLNVGLAHATGDIITIFDAEDEPHHDLYHVINTIAVTEGVDVIQSGVQLMNYETSWYSLLNILEYYFWFKSGLHFFSRLYKAAPLGGNTVFFKKEWLIKAHGWDEACLTEDADIGIRLAALGAKLRVVYKEELVTREETPSSLASFIKQRTRWNQGFLQVFMKGDWFTLPQFRQKLLIVYLLLSPLFQAFLIFYIPLGLFVAFTQKLPVAVSLLSYMPFYLMILQMGAYFVGIYKFTKDYRKYFSITLLLKILITFYPYQLVLAYAAFRAVFRQIVGSNGWEKTAHLNAHRLG